MKFLILLIALVVLEVQSQGNRHCYSGFEVDIKLIKVPDVIPICRENEIHACAYDERTCWEQHGKCGEKPCKYE